MPSLSIVSFTLLNGKNVAKVAGNRLIGVARPHFLPVKGNFQPSRAFDHIMDA